MEILYSNANKIYIKICCFKPTNSTFYKTNNLDKIFPYNGLEHDIYSLRKEGSTLLLGNFNVIKITNQDIILRNESNPNPI
jgi:hypothetical protein